ncbi:MAG: DUF373 family protein [Candidatus Diapherotrites archaeon]
MAELNNILVVCVDRDNDLGIKAGITGPILGRKANINAAAKLAIKDPSDSDVNSIFAAVKKFDEVKKHSAAAEIVTLTGHGKTDYESDKKINQQIDKVLENFPADGFVLVTDGAEDDQVIPILQSRLPIISKEILIIKQAKQVESTYYTIKAALKDPALARIFFLIPGIIILFGAILYAIGRQELFIMIIAAIVGLYAILRGLGLEEKIEKFVVSFARSFSLQRTSVFAYVVVLLLFVFGGITAYPKFITALFEYYSAGVTDNVVNNAANGLGGLMEFGALAIIVFLIGRAIDAIHLKKAFYLRTYFLSGIYVLLILFVLEAGKHVIIQNIDLYVFILSAFASFVVALIVTWASGVFEVRDKITKLMIGLPVYNKDGKWVGKVGEIEKAKNSIAVKGFGSKKDFQLNKKEFIFRDGRIQIV